MKLHENISDITHYLNSYIFHLIKILHHKNFQNITEGNLTR